MNKSIKNSKSVISIITPNTDTYTNPTMTALFHILKEQRVDVYLFGPDQQPSCPDNIQNVRFVRSVFKLNLFKNPIHFKAHWTSYFKIIRLLRKEKISTLLAVDPMGIIVGGRIKRFIGKKINLSYISFEIFFKNELSGYYLKMKEKEIYYSGFIDSLLIQDEKRRDLLINENSISIPPECIALVPVSPVKIEIAEKPDIHTSLNIPVDKKLVIYSGSVGAWCGTDAIIEAFDKGYWNNDYWLVFHTRKIIQSNDAYYEELMRLENDVNIPFSMHPHPFDSFEELSVFLSGFDLALALYYPNNENPYYGKNMKEIGLSSGKFSTYMMLGIPTIVTPCDIYADLILKYPFGAVLQDINQIGTLLSETVFDKQGAYQLYNEKLQPMDKLKKYIEIINTLQKNK
jgi:hypothetical protein